MRVISTSIILSLLTCVGCDDTPAPPPALVKDLPEEQPPPPRPTTQELLSGPRTSVSLGVLPLTVRAPAGWAVKTVEGTNVTLLEGPTPAGEASIQLATRANTTQPKLDALVNGAKNEMKQNPDSVKLAELRDLGGAKALERQRVGKTPSAAAVAEGEKPSPLFSWTISVFIPRGTANYETYELNFIGLTADQYEADKGLLREIIDSLSVDSAGAAATPPATLPAAATP